VKRVVAVSVSLGHPSLAVARRMIADVANERQRPPQLFITVVIETEDPDGPCIVGRSRDIHDEASRKQIVPVLGSRPAFVDENVRKGRGRISDVGTLFEREENLANQAVYSCRIVILVWLSILIELLQAVSTDALSASSSIKRRGTLITICRPVARS
jgi:hypothetical protein